MTTTITCGLLFLGACLAGLGTLLFLAAVPAAPDPYGTSPSAPDPETLRLTWLTALCGQRTTAPGLVLGFVVHPAAGMPYILLLVVAGLAYLASFLTTRAAPELIRRAAAWSI